MPSIKEIKKCFQFAVTVALDYAKMEKVLKE